MCDSKACGRDMGPERNHPLPVLPWPSYLGTLVAVHAQCTLSTHPLCSSRPRTAVLPPILRGSYGWSWAHHRSWWNFWNTVSPHGMKSPLPQSPTLEAWSATDARRKVPWGRWGELESQRATGHPCGPRGYGHPCSGLHIHLGAHTPPCRSGDMEALLQPGVVPPHQALLLETGKESSLALVLDFLLMYVTTEDLLPPGTLHEAQITAQKVMTWESCSPTQTVFSHSPQSQWMTKHSTFLFHLKGDVNWH